MLQRQLQLAYLDRRDVLSIKTNAFALPNSGQR